MSKIAEVAKKFAWVGAIVSMPSIMGNMARQAIEDAVHFEKIAHEFQRLGIPDEDVQLHEEVVKRLGQTSPIFSNRAVEYAGMTLMQRNAMKGIPIIPTDPRRWAGELWDEIVFANLLEVERTMRSSYGCNMWGPPVTIYDLVICGLKLQWETEAEKLWNGANPRK